MSVEALPVALDENLDQAAEGSEGAGRGGEGGVGGGGSRRDGGDGAERGIDVPLGHAGGVLVEQEMDGLGDEDKLGKGGGLLGAVAERGVHLREAELIGGLERRTTWQS